MAFSFSAYLICRGIQWDKSLYNWPRSEFFFFLFFFSFPIQWCFCVFWLRSAQKQSTPTCCCLNTSRSIWDVVLHTKEKKRKWGEQEEYEGNTVEFFFYIQVLKWRNVPFLFSQVSRNSWGKKKTIPIINELWIIFANNICNYA